MVRATENTPENNPTEREKIYRNFKANRATVLGNAKREVSREEVLTMWGRCIVPLSRNRAEANSSIRCRGNEITAQWL